VASRDDVTYGTRLGHALATQIKFYIHHATPVFQSIEPGKVFESAPQSRGPCRGANPGPAGDRTTHSTDQQAHQPNPKPQQPWGRMAQAVLRDNCGAGTDKRERLPGSWTGIQVSYILRSLGVSVFGRGPGPAAEEVANSIISIRQPSVGRGADVSLCWLTNAAFQPLVLKP